MEVPGYEGAKLLTNKTPGCVLQVVEAVASVQVTTSTTNTLVDVGASATITPSATSSKILVIAQYSQLIDGGPTETHNIILRNGSNISATSGAKQSCSTGTEWKFLHVEQLDSPNTTNAVTYKTQTRRVNGTGTIYSGTGEDGSSRMILMEIAA